MAITTYLPTYWLLSNGYYDLPTYLPTYLPTDNYFMAIMPTYLLTTYLLHLIILPRPIRHIGY